MDSYLTEIPEAKFYLQTQRIFLTYRSHLDKKNYSNFLKKKMNGGKSNVVDIIILAHEKGDKTTSYPHTHVFVKTLKRFQTRNSRYFDYDDIHPHIKSVKSKKHESNIYRYLAK
ncbi:unnamed protein product, partial [marine sediment metagenome]